MIIGSPDDKCRVCLREFDHNSNIIIAGNYDTANHKTNVILVFGIYCTPCFLRASNIAQGKGDE